MSSGFFGLSARQTNVRTEILAGVTTFLTMAYIIFVNPTILAAAGMDRTALIVVTCLVSALATIATGLLANAPIAMAPGMGLNAFFAYSLVIGDQITWQTALGVVFLSGLFFVVLTVLGLRRRLIEAIPAELVAAISVGIGLFITFIGLVHLGLIVPNAATLVSAGPLKPTVLIGLAGLAVMIVLEVRRIKGALLIGIAFSTALAVLCGFVARPERVMSLDLNISAVWFELDIVGALKWSLIGSVFTLMFMDMFDSIGTLVACADQAGMVDEHRRIKGLDRLLCIDAAATMAGALLGTSTTTAYLESAAGIEQGGRTGLTSVVTGLLFLLAVLFVPLVGIVPAYATSGALIMVGFFMMRQVRLIDFTQLHQAFPAFIIIVMIALSYSISTGLAFGFVAYGVISLISGRAGQVKPVMWAIVALSVLFLVVS